MSVINSLPRIVLVTRVSDFGPGGAACPHCGATGRWVYSFVCEDGSHRGAMKGCIQLFPQDFLVRKSIEILGKAERSLQDGKKLNRWDDEELFIIDQLYKEAISVERAIEEIKGVEADKARWMRSKGYRR